MERDRAGGGGGGPLSPHPPAARAFFGAPGWHTTGGFQTGFFALLPPRHESVRATQQQSLAVWAPRIRKVGASWPASLEKIPCRRERPWSRKLGAPCLFPGSTKALRGSGDDALCSPAPRRQEEATDKAALTRPKLRPPKTQPCRGTPRPPSKELTWCVTTEAQHKPRPPSLHQGTACANRTRPWQQGASVRV